MRKLAGKRVLVTGADGSIGAGITETLALGSTVFPTDIDSLDVTNPSLVKEAMDSLEPEVVFHMAAAKSAGDGELNPWDTVRKNIIGTQNVIRWLPTGAVLVTASTCKAADPETAYGATKLIAERLTLNASQRVARFFNVVESSGNVFQTWMSTHPEVPLPVAGDCHRYFISWREAVNFTIACSVEAPGRYTIDPGERRNMWDVALGAYPDRQLVHIHKRRGDRTKEPFSGAAEEIIFYREGGLIRIVGEHDGGD